MMAFQPMHMQAQNGGGMHQLTKPRLEIIEQPKSRGFRFRYDCEGQSHGGLPGENSEKNRKQKTYPTVRLLGYRGRARVMVSLVSDTDPPVPHAHSIVGKNTNDGRCVMEMGPETEMYAQFPNMGILHVTKKKVPDVLTKRLLQQLAMKDSSLDQLDINTDQKFSDDEKSTVSKEATQIAKAMNLSVVRLCFQAFLMDEHGRFTIAVEPVFSHKVYDSKAPSAGNLKICRLDRANGSVRGGDDVFLLCDKVQKNDIEVIFYEEKQDNSINPVQPWSAKGRFGPNDVHHQYAIVFQTPPFYNLAVERPVNVWIALRRPSDNEMSEPKPFLYLPQEFDEERIGAKRKKKLQHFNNFFDGSGGGSGFGSGGGGLGGFFSRSAGFGDMSFGSMFNKEGGGAGGGGGGSANSGGAYSGGGTNAAGGFEQAMMDMNEYSFSGSLSDRMSEVTLSNPANFGAPPAQYPFPEQQMFNHTTTQTMPSFRQPIQQPPPYHQQQVPDMYYQQPHDQFNMSDPQYGSGYPEIQSRGGGVVKMERFDPSYGERVELDCASQRRPGEADTATRHGGPPQGKNMDFENEESGIADVEKLDSGLPQDEATTEQTEGESRQARQALADRQQAAFQVCERMFNALLAWATTRDVRYLLAAQRSLTAVQNQQGDTALHLAIIHNHQDVVLQLLDVLPQLPPTETPVVDCLNSLKQSPLHLAIITHQHKVIQYLLKANANPLVCDREGNTPLHLACRLGFVQGAVALLNRTNHINAEGCRIPEVNIRNSNGETPLHLAAKMGHTDVLKLLVNAKVDIDVQDSKSGRTALHHAVEKGDLPMVGYLVTEAGCNLDCSDFSGNTPLHVASGLGQAAIVSLLIAGGADVAIQNQEGESPVTHAEYRNNDEVAALLQDAYHKAADDEQLSAQMQTVTIKGEGDMKLLDFRARISLGILLDRADRWRTLCRHLNLSNLESGLAMFTSPTKDLLSMYEAYDGTIARLRQSLIDMNHLDAVNIIDRALAQASSVKEQTSKPSEESSSGSKSPPVFGSEHMTTAPQRSVIDSGIVSQSEELGSQIGTHIPTTVAPNHAPFDALATTQA